MSIDVSAGAAGDESARSAGGDSEEDEDIATDEEGDDDDEVWAICSEGRQFSSRAPSVMHHDMHLHPSREACVLISRSLCPHLEEPVCSS